MANLQRYFPGAVNPDQYDPPVDGLDYMPMMPELVDLSTTPVSITTSSTKLLEKLENGIQFAIIGTGFTFDTEGKLLTGTITELRALTSAGAIIEKITGLHYPASDFEADASGNLWSVLESMLGGNDILKGGKGDDDLYGYFGDDTLIGGDGDDYFVGGPGKDTYDGGNGFDQISWGDWTGKFKHGVTVDVTKHTAIDPYGNKETFSSIESFRGTKFADTFKGSGDDEEFMGLAGADTIDGGGGFDVVRYHRDVNAGGTRGVTVDLGKGKATDGFGNLDTLVSVEGARGSDRADKLIGSAGSNWLRGDGGTDTLYGKAGNDYLIGGGGKDTFVFDTALSKTSNVDDIQDFSVKDDIFRLENGIFTQIIGTGTLSSAQFWASATGKAHDASDRIIYDKDDGYLYYDRDGSGKAEAVLFATLSDGLKLSEADFLIL